MTARIAYFVFLRRSAKNMAAKFKGRAKKKELYLQILSPGNSITFMAVFFMEPIRALENVTKHICKGIINHVSSLLPKF